jgi:hypothetical protein
VVNCADKYLFQRILAQTAGATGNRLFKNKTGSGQNRVKLITKNP